jgi:hypothetical protein
MKRSEVVALVTALVVVAGCSDSRDGASFIAAPSGARASVLEELETAPELIAALFDGGNETAALARWNALVALRDGGKLEQSGQLAVSLAQFVVLKERQDELLDPDGDAAGTVSDGVQKLLRLLLGAGFAVPAPNGDAVIAFIDDRAQTVVTPSNHAGFEIGANSTPHPFFLVIDEQPGLYPPCSGPLNTKLCQFPLYYRFTPYPDTRLTRKAKFGVCTLEPGRGAYAPTEAQHDRMRLAHNLGAHRQWADRSRIVDGIEVLPYVGVDFLSCDDVSYPPDIILQANPLVRGGTLALAWLRDVMSRTLLPRQAFAIDRGGGGEADFFSPFNAVDYVTLPPIYDGPIYDGPIDVIGPIGKLPRNR